jgi:hypothetical protein
MLAQQYSTYKARGKKAGFHTQAVEDAAYPPTH